MNKDITYIVDEELLEMFRINTVNDITFIEDECDIEKLIHNIECREKCGNLHYGTMFIYNKEGINIPHFHIKRFKHPSCCIKILSNEYFIHGMHTGTLNNKEAKILYKWFIEDKNRWLRIINVWNKHIQNDSDKISINSPLPDYKNINS